MAKRIAIAGIAAVNSLGADVEAIWSAMMASTCGIRPMSRFPRGLYMTDFAAEVPPEVESRLRAVTLPAGAGRARLYALSAARQALDSGVVAVDLSRMGLVLSTAKAELDALERLAASGDVSDATHNPYELARAIAGDLGVAGPVFAVSAACASGPVAIASASRILQRGEAEAVLVVGVDVVAGFLLAGFSALAALSRRPCRPYDESRDGMSLGEGAGAVLLTAPGVPVARPLAYVLGWGVTDDAAHITAPSRSGEELTRAMSCALSMAGLAPEDVDCVNGHGTATVYNDLMEAKALRALFGEAMPPVMSMKGYFGHTLGAAGVIEAALSVVAMRERIVPGCMGLTHLGVEGPLNISPGHRAVERMANVLAIKSGFGGVNAAVALSGAP